ncbi:MAG: hypothetical protein KJ072_28660 [Verrucomicrobia bacterium]|nr:hypothetical protein [Verrucomicrobiota bacterium]
MTPTCSGYLQTVCEYVHLNPARAKLLRPEQSLREYRWRSWPDYLRSPEKRPAWLRVDWVFGEMGIPKDSVAGRRETLVTVAWIAARLQMGSAAHVNTRLYQWRQGRK